jgi:uncharacterized protein (TIGR03067 family)
MRDEVNGVGLPFAFLRPKEEQLAVFSGDRLTTKFMEGKGFTFRLDPKKKPKAIDLHPLENTDKTTRPYSAFTS